jgi:hypothetical protein
VWSMGQLLFSELWYWKFVGRHCGSVGGEDGGRGFSGCRGRGRGFELATIGWHLVIVSKHAGTGLPFPTQQVCI